MTKEKLNYEVILLSWLWRKHTACIKCSHRKRKNKILQKMCSSHHKCTHIFLHMMQSLANVLEKNLKITLPSTAPGAWWFFCLEEARMQQSCIIIWATATHWYYVRRHLHRCLRHFFCSTVPKCASTRSRCQSLSELVVVTGQYVLRGNSKIYRIQLLSCLNRLRIGCVCAIWQAAKARAKPIACPSGSVPLEESPSSVTEPETIGFSDNAIISCKYRVVSDERLQWHLLFISLSFLFAYNGTRQLGNLLEALSFYPTTD